MVTEFELIDSVGNVIGEGEIENGVHRLFSDEFPNGYQEFETLKALLAQSEGVAIQPHLFLSSARTRQLGLLDDDDVEYRASTDPRMRVRDMDF